jgi:hypothetical protein
MSTDELLAELTTSFGPEPRPDEGDIVTNNAPGYDLESLQIRDTFKAYTWQALPQALLEYEQGGFNFLSRAGLRYYLPAYLHFAVRDYAAADAIPDRLIQALTLPAEIDEVLSALATSQYGFADTLPDIDWPAFHQTRLRELDQRVHDFIHRYGQFTAAQGRTILHFLEYMQQAHGLDYLDNEPGIAITRYWFQFA